MIKRIGKTKQSKQGAILVIVVLILALAMIFISSAMMLTQATRARLYDNSMSSQARLTVTAASEVFLEALQTQEITDDQIDKLLVNTPARHTNNNDKIKMLITGVPGMSNKSDNCTYLDLYYPDTGNKDIVNADFTTVIGDQAENIRIVLHVKHRDPSYGGRFKNQIDIGGTTAVAELRFTKGVGMVNPELTDVSDNTILLRGSATEHASSAIFYSDMIFAEGAVSEFGGGNTYHGNMIFLDSAYMSTYSSVKAMDGDFYFIGKSNNDAGMIFKQDAGWTSIANKSRFVFSGRTAQDKSKDKANDQNGKIKDVLTSSGRQVYFVGNSNSVVLATNGNQNQYYNGTQYTYSINNLSATNSLPADLAKNLNTYKSYNYTSSSEPFPSNVVKDVFMDLNPDGKTKTIAAGTTLTQDEYSSDGKTLYKKNEKIDNAITVIANPITKYYPESKKVNGAVPDNRIINMGNLGALDPDGDRIISLSEGYYLIKGGTTTNSNTNLKPYVLCINGAKAADYRFYFEAGSTFNLNLCVFALYNVQSDPAPVVFVMEPGAEINMSGPNYRNDDKCICATGFLSMNRSKTSANAIGSYVQTKSVASEAKVWSDAYKDEGNNAISYSEYYDSKAKPSIYIFGTGSNKFIVGDCCTFEAYIGLYEGSTFGARNDIDNNKPVYIYGRVEANKFDMGNTTGGFCMPYCPAPGQANKDPNNRPAETKFEIVQIVYYYDSGSSTPSGSSGTTFVNTGS